MTIYSVKFFNDTTTTVKTVKVGLYSDISKATNAAREHARNNLNRLYDWNMNEHGEQFLYARNGVYEIKPLTVN